MATGQVGLLVRTIRTSSPCRSWSVLLLAIQTTILPPLIEISHDRSLISSSARKNPAYANRHADAKRMLDKVGFLTASSTIALKISAVTGAFFTTGLARILFNPSSVACTRGLSPGDSKPARLCAQDSACTASSTAAFDCTRSPMCWRCNVTWCPSAGKVLKSCCCAHALQRLNAPRYFFVDDCAQLWSTVLGSILASLISSGSSNSSRATHAP